MKNKKFWISVLAGLMALVMLLGLILSVLPRASAASSSEIKDQIEQMEDEIKEREEAIQALKNQKWENRTETKAIMEQKANIDQQVGLLRTQIRAMDEQISAYALLIAEKQVQLQDAQEHLAYLNEKYKERIRAMEEDGELSYWSVLFEANSFSDFLDRLNMIEEIAAGDRRRLAEMEKAAKIVEEAKVVLETEMANLEATRAEYETVREDLDIQAQKSQALLTELLAKGDEFTELIEASEEEQDKLTSDLSDLETKYEDALYSEFIATSTTATTAPPPSYSGGGTGGTSKEHDGIIWLVPVSYDRVSSAYGYRTHPITGEKEKWHHGVDLAGVGIYGRPIVATRGGIVEFAGWYGAGGWTIKLDHGDGYETYYMHMIEYIVEAGEYVVPGQVIGYVGSSGGSTGPHLHFEIRYNGNSVNPMDYIG